MQIKDVISKYAQIFSITAIPLIIINETIFLSTINSELIKLMTLSDYLASSLAWLPHLFLFTLIGVVFSANRLFKSGLTEHKPHEPKIQGWRRKIWYVLLPLNLVVLVAFGPSVVGLHILILPGLNIMFLFWVFVLDWEIYILPESSYGVLNTLFTGFIGILLLSITISYFTAYAHVSSKSGAFRMSNFQDKELILIRSLHSGLLVRELSTEMIHLVGHDGKIIISTKNKFKDTDKNICKWTGYFCKEIKLQT